MLGGMVRKTVICRLTTRANLAKPTTLLNENTSTLPYIAASIWRSRAIYVLIQTTSSVPTTPAIHPAALLTNLPDPRKRSPIFTGPRLQTTFLTASPSYRPSNIHNRVCLTRFRFQDFELRAICLKGFWSRKIPATYENQLNFVHRGIQTSPNGFYF